MQQLNLTAKQSVRVQSLRTVHTVRIHLRGNWPAQTTLTKALAGQGYRLLAYGIDRHGAYLRLEPLAAVTARAA